MPAVKPPRGARAVGAGRCRVRPWDPSGRAARGSWAAPAVSPFTPASRSPRVKGEWWSPTMRSWPRRQVHCATTARRVPCTSATVGPARSGSPSTTGSASTPDDRPSGSPRRGTDESRRLDGRARSPGHALCQGPGRLGGCAHHSCPTASSWLAGVRLSVRARGAGGVESRADAPRPRPPDARPGAGGNRHEARDARRAAMERYREDADSAAEQFPNALLAEGLSIALPLFAGMTDRAGASGGRHPPSRALRRCASWASP